MEAADGSINSKVIVQFTDPSGLFDAVAPLLRGRLPLGNLHWKSPTRPLRSIEELDVSLEREQTTSTDGAAGAGARRHQIPGLRQTPFLKVLLLRCDDREKYKESVRKETKDWVKSLGFSTSGKSVTKGQERHDAYEYIIVHVVFPGTPAASQPKSSKHISLDATDSSDSVNSRSKWTGKSTSTVFDKLKADFSSSSKAPFERVAQVRLVDPSKPSAGLGPLEIEEQWQDLVDKMKVAILQSFDARVAQYEDDIRERESQRSLPGWNFCTFFILKEGLARGFENVGLLEDALQIYEELDAGLDAVIQDQAKEDHADAANALLPYASDLKDTIRSALAFKDQGSSKEESSARLSLQAWANAEAERSPWKLERRNYQQMILTNEISALDFRIYIFIRQMQIMLRRAGTANPLPRSKAAKRDSGPRWDANLLSEICERTVKFVNLAARNLGQDLFAAWGGHEGLVGDELETQKAAIANIVASWKWSWLLEALSECQIIASFSNNSGSNRNGDVDEGDLFSPGDIANTQARHEHSQSFSTTASTDTSNPVNGATAPATKDMFAALRIVKGTKSELMFWAAELFMMLRTILLQLCQGANLLPSQTTGAFSASRADGAADVILTGILAPSLRSALSNGETVLNAYKLLTVCACQCYITAGKQRASRQLLFDLAGLEAHNDKYDAAASWLDAVSGFLEAPPRTSLEGSMLALYIDCLRKAGRKQDLVRSLFLELRAHGLYSQARYNVQQTWQDITDVTEDLEGIELPFDQIFAIEKIDTHIRYDKACHHCTVTLTLQVLVPVEIFGEANLLLECESRGHHLPAKLHFSYSGRIVAQKGRIQLDLRSTTISEGWYDITLLQLSFGKLKFEHDFRQGLSLDEAERHFPHTANVAPSLYMYPILQLPLLQATHAHMVDLSQKRNMLLSVRWGLNAINTAELRLKPATAGARLDLASARTADGRAFILAPSGDSQVLAFQDIMANSVSVIEIPYSLDDASAASMSVRVELKYQSPTGSFNFYDTLTFVTLLPVSVNVQDIFQANTAFSRFTIGPSRLVPISVLDCNLEDNASCKIIAPEPWSGAVDAFPKQPVSWVVRTQVTRKQHPAQEKLKLTVNYRCIDEIVLETIQKNFLAAITDSAFAPLGRPLAAHLRYKVQSLWTEHGIEHAALVSQVEMWSFEELDWISLLYAFEKKERPGLQEWLRKWHASAETIPLESDLAPVRTLKLLVDPPNTQVVVTAALQPTSDDNYIVGQPILARLIVKCHMRAANTEAEVMVEITGQPDIWLVGGQRKLAFPTSHESFEATIVLIAQKTGKLLLPSIDVRCRDSKDLGKVVSFEVENLSSATTIMARNDVRSTTLGVGDGETAQGHWLI